MRKFVSNSKKPIIGKNGKKFLKGDIIFESDLYNGVSDILLKTGKINYFFPEINYSENSRMIVFIFSYNRKEMLHSLIDECKQNNCDVVIIDDGSDFKINHDNVLNFVHEGKSMHWKRWNEALRVLKNLPHEKVAFFADDFKNVNFDFEFPEENCVLNVLNDGRLKNWNDIDPIDRGDFYKVGFTDCGFFTTKTVISKIGFFVNEVLKNWGKKYSSSGVGVQLTNRFLNENIPMYTPKKSLAYHGDHQSMMHPELRKLEPLISK